MPLQGGWLPAFSFLAQEPSYVLSSTDLAAVPLFLMMGVFASMAGFSEDVYRAAAAFLGHRRGGLAYATIGGSAAFGAICGSSTATAATFGKVALPQMLDRGYSPAFSTGVIAAGGTLKSLIPPSLVMIIYCVVAKTFILDMFVAAIVPGADDYRVQPDRYRHCGPTPSADCSGQRASVLATSAGSRRGAPPRRWYFCSAYSSASTAASLQSTKRRRRPPFWLCCLRLRAVG